MRGRRVLRGLLRQDANPANVRVGWTAGAGLDWRLDSRWSARAEYLYTSFNLSGFAFASAPARYDTQYDLHRVRFGLNYRFGEVEEVAEMVAWLASDLCTFATGATFDLSGGRATY